MQYNHKRKSYFSNTRRASEDDVDKKVKFREATLWYLQQSKSKKEVKM